MTTRMERKQRDLLNRVTKMMPGRKRLEEARRAAWTVPDKEDMLLVHQMVDVLVDVRRLLREEEARSRHPASG